MARGTVQPLRSAFVLSHMLPPYFYQPFFELLFLAPLLWYCRDRANPRAPLLLGRRLGLATLAVLVIAIRLALLVHYWLRSLFDWSAISTEELAFQLLVPVIARR